MRSPVESDGANNALIKTVTEERLDDAGRRVRITRRIRMRLVTEEVSPEVAARRVRDALRPMPILILLLLTFMIDMLFGRIGKNLVLRLGINQVRMWPLRSLVNRSS